MANKPIVFHIAKWYPNRHDSLLGIFVKRHVLSTLPSTLPVLFYAMASVDVIKTWYEIEEVMEDGVYTYRCYYKKQITKNKVIDKIIKLMIYAFLTFKVYHKAKRKFGKPDLIHAHVLLRTAVMAKCLELYDRVPYVLLEHASIFIREEVSAFSSRIIQKLAQYVVSESKAVMTVSFCLAQGMQKRYGLHNKFYKVVYNSVDTVRFSYGGEYEKQQKKEFVYVAEFDETSKNTKGLLESIASLANKRQDFLVYIIGYGKDEALLYRTADVLGIKDKIVFFTGKLTGDALVSKVKSAEALLLFSNFETLSCVITEALCCGTPVVSTAVGGIVEIVTLKNGILIPKANQLAMEQSIELFLDGKVVFDRTEISKSAHLLFSNESVGGRIVEVYKKAIAC